MVLHMNRLLNSCRNSFVFFITPLILVACGGGGGSGGDSASEGPALSQDTQFVYIERSVEKDVESRLARFKSSAAAQERAPLDLTSPYDFQAGAKLISRSSLDVNAVDTEVLTNYFNSSEYDVKDLNIRCSWPR
jgi:hypothetical protein